MMYFPQMYPDELLVSAIARYHVHTMSPTYSATKAELFGMRHIHPNLELPCSLGLFQKNTYYQLGLTAAEIAWSHTMLPYYTSYNDENTYDEVLATMIERGKRRSPITMLGAQLQPTSAPKMMRACPNCIAEDMETHGETYWRRSQQLRTVHFCIRHNSPLMNTPYSYVSSPHRFEAANSEMPLANYLPSLSNTETKKMLRISNILCSCLTRSKFDSDFVRLPDFKEILTRSKYMRGQKLNAKSFVVDFNNFFGSKILELLGMTADPEEKESWVRAVLHRSFSVTPVKVALLKLFCEKLETREPRPGPWLCQNKLARHYGTPVMTQCTMLKNGMNRFECTCGFIFTTKIDEWTSEGEPIRKRIVRISPEHLELIRQKHFQGTSQKELMQWLKVSNRFIYKIINKIEPKHRPDPQAARQALLMKNLNSKSKPASNNLQISSWATKDRNAQEIILQAVKNLRVAQPPVRITISALARHTKLSFLRKMKSATKLPLTTACINENIESMDECRVRAVVWNFENWPKYEKMNRTSLSKRASVKPRHLLATAMVDTLVSELNQKLLD